MMSDAGEGLTSGEAGGRHLLAYSFFGCGENSRSGPKSSGICGWRPPPRVCQTRGVDRKEMRHLGSGYQKKQGFEEWVLPREFSLEVAELTGALREGLTAVGLKAAMVIAQQMLAAEVDAIAGAKGKHQVERRVTRHGHQGGQVVLAGRKVKLQRPQVRTQDGTEVEPRNYRGLQQGEMLDRAASERMLNG